MLLTVLKQQIKGSLNPFSFSLMSKVTFHQISSTSELVTTSFKRKQLQLDQSEKQVLNHRFLKHKTYVHFSKSLKL